MTKMIKFYDLISTTTVEFNKLLYFRIEILRSDTGEDIESTEYIAEVYQLRFPNGVMTSPSKGRDTRFRQSWLYLEDFPSLIGSSPEGLEKQVKEKLFNYAEAYLNEYQTRLCRA